MQPFLFRLLDLLYLIGLRIGEEMARTHMTTFCSAFFSTFDKAVSKSSPEEVQDEGERFSLALAAQTTELSHVLTPELAYSAYVTFYNPFGRAHLEENILNLEKIRHLCLQHQEKTSNLLRPATFDCLRSPATHQVSSNQSSGSSALGNNSKVSAGLLLSGAARGSFSFGLAVANEDLHNFISRDLNDSGRHLKGNWLAFWENEAGRAEKEGQLGVKQILLQVKCLN